MQDLWSTRMDNQVKETLRGGGGSSPRAIQAQDSQGFSPQAILPRDLEFPPREEERSSAADDLELVGPPPAVVQRGEAEEAFAAQAQNSLKVGGAAEHPDSDKSSLGSEAGAGFAG